MTLVRATRSESPPPAYELTSLETCSTLQRRGSDATDTPRSRARSRRKASDELPIEKSARMARYERRERGRREGSVLPAGWPAGASSGAGSRTVSRSRTATTPGTRAAQKTDRIDEPAARSAV